MRTPERESALRLEIGRRMNALTALAAGLRGGTPMLKGSVYVRVRRCGRPRCRCARGLLHRERVLAVRRGGRVVTRRLDPALDTAASEAALAWGVFRRRRAELARACRGLLSAVDRLAALRLARGGGRP